MHWIYLIHEFQIFELNYWNKWTFPRHSNLLRCTCTWICNNALLPNYCNIKEMVFRNDSENDASIKYTSCMATESQKQLTNVNIYLTSVRHSLGMSSRRASILLCVQATAWRSLTGPIIPSVWFVDEWNRCFRHFRSVKNKVQWNNRSE